jgi:hypothetical protein
LSLPPNFFQLGGAVKAEAERRPEVVRLTRQKGVGPVVGLAFVLTLGSLS